MLVGFPSLPSVQFKPVISSFSSLFSAPCANSALTPPHNSAARSSQSAEPPTHFPLFPHQVNVAHTQTPANPSPSIVYSTFLCTPGGSGTSRSRPLRLRPMPTPMPAPVSSISPLNATLTKNIGAPPSWPPRRPRPSLIQCSLPTTHFPNHFATLFRPGTRHDS